MTNSNVEEGNMQQNPNIQLNWGTFNVPTIVGLITILLMIWDAGAYQQKQEARLEALRERVEELISTRNKLVAENEQRLKSIEALLSTIPNLSYRITIAEQGLVSTNARIDRQSDAIGSLREDIGGVRTALEVLTQKIEAAVPSVRTTPNR